MIKLLNVEGSQKVFEGEKLGKKVIIKVYDRENKYTTEQIEKALEISDLENWLKERYTLESILNENELNNIFELDMLFIDNPMLKPLNYSLYEYLVYFKKEDKNKVPKVLKSAYISIDRECNFYYIAGENYDNESIITNNNEGQIYKYANILQKEIEKLLGMTFSHVEIYK